MDRYCIKEQFHCIEHPPYTIDTGVAVQGDGPMKELKIWTFHYNDGTIEQVCQTGPAK